MFDPYRKWLGIPPWEQPANHYRLLGINIFEDDPDVIEAAADRQMAHIRNYQAGQHSALSQKLLNELAAARVCLLDPERKKAYDGELRLEISRRRGEIQFAGPPFGFFVRGAARYFVVEARRLRLARSALPSAYLALGQDIVREGRYRQRLPDLYAKLEKVTERLASLEASKVPEEAGGSDAPASGEPKSRGVGAAMKRLGRSAGTTARSAYYSSREKAVLREIAQAAWRVDHDQSGPAELTARVRDALTGLEECRAEVKTLSEIPAHHWLSPKRLAWIVLAVLAALALLYLWARWMLR